MTSKTSQESKVEPPFPLIELPLGDFNSFYYRIQVGMSNAHNFMIRGLNSIYTQAHIPQTDAEKRSFAGYALCWCEFTHHHHEGEERFFFPAAEKNCPGSMEENVEQHKMFTDGLHTMETYFAQVKKNPSTYDGDKVTAMIDQFGRVFVLHLREEIDTLEPKKLEKIFPDVKVLMDAHFTMMKWNISSSNKLTTLPWVVSHHEARVCPWFLGEEVPAVVIFLARYVFSLFNWGYWRWSPCTLRSVMKPDAKVGTIKPLLK